MENQKAAELRLLYQDALDEIRFAKRQQWVGTNYAVLLYGAIITVFGFVGSRPCEDQGLANGILGSVALLVAVAGTFTLVRLQMHLAGNRKRLREIRKYFSPEFDVAWGAYSKPDHLSLFHGSSILLVLIFTLWIGLGAVWWFLYAGPMR